MPNFSAGHKYNHMLSQYNHYWIYANDDYNIELFNLGYNKAQENKHEFDIFFNK